MKHISDPSNPAVAELMNKIPADKLEILQHKLNALEKSLLDADPQMPQHLRESHAVLISYPETVHLLDDNEIKALVRAAQEWTKTEIVKEPAKKGGSKKKIDVDDL